MRTGWRELLELHPVWRPAGLRICKGWPRAELSGGIPTMSQITNAKAASKLPAPGRWAFVLGLLALAAGCGDSSAPVAPPFTGTGGSGSSSGSGGIPGTGGVSGTGSTSGTGGMSGTGGTVGTGGTGGTVGPCVADTPPDSFLCDTDDNCAFSGWVCIDSGCKGDGGAPIKQCVPSWAPSCSSDNEDGDCPNASDYDCVQVGTGGERCVRVTSGCSPSTETYDCAPGFSCEGGTCVDRRVPCGSYQDCPKSHICLTVSAGLDPIAQYCARVSRTCVVAENDCTWLGNSFGSFCDDVDGDGTDECTGERDATGEACVNAKCGGAVCETGAHGSDASCASYGLCRFDNECGVGFECVGLWQDGRRECVPTGGTCDEVTDCDPQQVCAAPRNGGSPRCQTGKIP